MLLTGCTHLRHVHTRQRRARRDDYLLPSGVRHVCAVRCVAKVGYQWPEDFLEPSQLLNFVLVQENSPFSGRWIRQDHVVQDVDVQTQVIVEIVSRIVSVDPYALLVFRISECGECVRYFSSHLGILYVSHG